MIKLNKEKRIKEIIIGTKINDPKLNSKNGKKMKMELKINILILL